MVEIMLSLSCDGTFGWRRSPSLGAAAVLLHSGAASAQQTCADYPSQPVRMIVGLAPGGSNDLIARVVAQKLTERLGQPFVVENKAGAGGTIAAEMVARAAPDGYTLLVAPSGSMVINPAVYSKLPYDPLTSYELISNIALYHLVLSVSATQPFKSVQGAGRRGARPIRTRPTTPARRRCSSSPRSCSTRRPARNSSTSRSRAAPSSSPR